MKHQNNATLSEKTIIYQTTFEKLKQMKRVLGDRSIPIAREREAAKLE